jgi:rRNA maturation endonuclease Nob1
MRICDSCGRVVSRADEVCKACGGETIAVPIKAEVPVEPTKPDCEERSIPDEE